MIPIDDCVRLAKLADMEVYLRYNSSYPTDVEFGYDDCDLN